MYTAKLGKFHTVRQWVELMRINISSNTISLYKGLPAAAKSKEFHAPTQRKQFGSSTHICYVLRGKAHCPDRQAHWIF
jgi:hypothetical protein